MRNDLDLTEGSIGRKLILFAVPMIAGDLLQKLYNITDTLIVGKAIGSRALAAVGSAYALMTFLTSVFIGLSMGSGVLFSICFGKNDRRALKTAVWHAFLLILVITLALNAAVCLFLDPILVFLDVPREILGSMRVYLVIIFTGLTATSLYNFVACLMRAVGNSVTPLWFLGSSAVLNIILDLLFVMGFRWGITGAAAATVIAQYEAGIGILICCIRKYRDILPGRQDLKFAPDILQAILDLSVLTCAQQSCMNFGILLVQRLVDGFGAVTMAAFAAAVKIDAFAYLPVQDFGNAFSIFIAQNHGAGRKDRVRSGFRAATGIAAAFSIVLSLLIQMFAEPLMRIFIRADETDVIACGVRYLHIEGAFYIGIGCLFLLYGYYRAMNRPGLSLLLTVISLGTRVALAYLLAPSVGEVGIWLSVPIGWFLADAAGYGLYFHQKRTVCS